jgi:hypothetical protein
VRQNRLASRNRSGRSRPTPLARPSALGDNLAAYDRAVRDAPQPAILRSRHEGGLAMTKTSSAAPVLSFILSAATGACGGSTASAPTGGLRQACYGNGTCNAGLTCASSICVAFGDGGSGGSSGPAGSSGAASGADSSSGGSSGSSSGSSGSGSGSTGGTDANVQDVATDATGGSPGLRCGGGAQPTFCDSSQICCYQTTTTYACQAASADCSGTPIQCTSPAECPQGEVCCGTVGTGAYYSNVICTSSCPGDAGTQQYQFCNRSAPVCPQGTTCSPSGYMPGYSVCIRQV